MSLCVIHLELVDDSTYVGPLQPFDLVLLSSGVGAALITLGENGVLYHDPARTVHVPAIDAGAVVETTGAGDAFNGGFATALARGLDPVDATRFGCATAGISVTRPGTAPSMPSLAEIEALLAAQT